VAGDHAYYFSGTSPEVLTAAVRQWMALRAEGKVPASEGIRRLTWAESSAQLLERILPREADQSEGRNVPSFNADTTARPIQALVSRKFVGDSTTGRYDPSLGAT
jgi:hypothetical protein